MRRVVTLIALLACIACENAEEKARYVKAPLDGVDVTNRASLNQAVSEARTRLVSVRDDRLRDDLAREIDAVYERALAEAREVERREAERRAIELEKKRQAAREREATLLEAERKRESERRKKQRRVQEREPEPDDQDDRRRAAVAAQRRRAKEGVTNLEVGIRSSLLGDGTKVLVLRNAKDYPVDFNLRCRTADDAFDKTFPLTVPAKGERRFGFVQGWCGNFKGGERCAAYVDGERMWEYTVP